MSGFTSALNDGKKGEDVVAHYYDTKFKANENYEGFEQILGIEEQRKYGDFRFSFEVDDTERSYYIECKTDQDDGRYGNIIVEDESNKGKRPGWLHHYEEVNFLCYYYPNQGFMLQIPWEPFKTYVLKYEDKWRKVNQQKYYQANIPVNFLVPVKTVMEDTDIGIKKITI